MCTLLCWYAHIRLHTHSITHFVYLSSTHLEICKHTPIASYQSSNTWEASESTRWLKVVLNMIQEPYHQKDRQNWLLCSPNTSGECRQAYAVTSQSTNCITNMNPRSDMETNLCTHNPTSLAASHSHSLKHLFFLSLTASLPTSTHRITHRLGKGCILFHPIIPAQVMWLYLALEPKIAFKFDFLNSLGKS